MEDIIKKYTELSSVITEMSYTYSIFNDRNEYPDKKIIIRNIKEENLLEGIQTGIDYEFGNNLLGSKFKPTDLLYLDTIHNYVRLKIELENFCHHVKNYIIIRGTKLYNNSDERGNGPGLLKAIEQFLENHQEWVILESTNDDKGITVLGRKKNTTPQPVKSVKRIKKKTTQTENGTD